MGNDEWLIVDSCIDRETHRPIALQYLEYLGVDIANRVHLVVATHWHNDHIRGIGEIHDAARSAKFFCSAALNHKEFWTFVAGSKERTPLSSYESEFDSILATIESRTPAGTHPGSIGPNWALENQCIHRGTLATVHALSPSHGTLTMSFRDRTGMEWQFPSVRREKGRPICLGPNQSSVVLWVEFDGIKILLGGDLEESSSPSIGWKAIVLSKARPPGKASVYKVAHHGSPNADSPGIWQDLLEADPYVVLTPFLAGPRPLPDKTDRQRIVALTSHAFLTASRTGWQGKTKTRHPLALRAARLRQRKLRTIEGPMGHVRFRMTIGRPSSATFDTFNGAQPL